MTATPIRTDLMFVSIEATASGYRGTWGNTANATSTAGVEMHEAASLDLLRDLAEEQGCPWDEDAAAFAGSTFVPISKRDVTSVCVRCGTVVAWPDRHRQWHQAQQSSADPTSEPAVTALDSGAGQPVAGRRRLRAGRTRPV